VGSGGEWCWRCGQFAPLEDGLSATVHSSDTNRIGTEWTSCDTSQRIARPRFAVSITSQRSLERCWSIARTAHCRKNWGQVFIFGVSQ